jgi:hypothetical protein
VKQDEWYGDRDRAHPQGTDTGESSGEVRAARSRSALALRVVLLSLLGVAVLVAVGVILVTFSVFATGDAKAP